MPPDASQLQNLQFGGGSAASILSPVALAVVLIAGILLLLLPRTNAIVPFLVAATVVFLNVLNFLNVIITCVFTGIGRPALHRCAVAASAVVMMIVIWAWSCFAMEKPLCRRYWYPRGFLASVLALAF